MIFRKHTVPYRLRLNSLLRSVSLVALLMLSMSSWSSSGSVSAKTFRELTAVQELISENKTTEALASLKKLHAEVQQDSLDEALVLQMLGYTEMGRNNYAEAVVYLRQSLALDKFPENMKYSVGYMVAQLYAAQDKFEEALTFAEGWFETLAEPTPDQTIFMANILAQTKNYQRAVPFAERAVKASPEPRESWYQLLVSCHFELENFKESAEVLQQIIQRWPEKPEYWEQLASVYVQLGNEIKGLATLQLAWKANVLQKESSIRAMIQLAITQRIPEHGARLLTAALDQELLPKDETYLDILANAWLSARENSAAIAAFEQLAMVSGEGDAYLRIANIHTENAEWQKAEQALHKGMALKLKEPGKAWLIMGIVMTEQAKFEQGIEAFRKARAFDETERQASSWLKYAEDLRRQHNWNARNQG